MCWKEIVAVVRHCDPSVFIIVSHQIISFRESMSGQCSFYREQRAAFSLLAHGILVNNCKRNKVRVCVVNRIMCM